MGCSKMSKTCNSCGTDKSPASVPYVVHESAMARNEREKKKLWIALIVAITIIFAQFAGFVWYESQFETISYDYQQDGQGTNIIGEGNEVNNGSTLENESKEETKE